MIFSVRDDFTVSTLETHTTLTEARKACAICNAQEIQYGRPARYSVDGEKVVSVEGLNLPDWAVRALEKT